jgi:UDP-glucose 4-epimerase
MDILVTGSSGYIGSFLISQNKTVPNSANFIGLDEVPHEGLARTQYTGSFCDLKLINRIFQENPKISHVIHLAALKSAPESAEKLHSYYETNIECTLKFIEDLSSQRIKKFIFASSAAVYDYSHPPTNNLLNENSKLGITSPYGVFKRLIEAEISRLAVSSPNIQFQSIRIFNPVGLNQHAHWSRRSDLLSKIASCIVENRIFEIRGNKFDTIDGTAVRDYIPLEDLATGILEIALSPGKLGFHEIFNLGSGKETTVLSLVRKVNLLLEAFNRELRYQVSSAVITDSRGYPADISKVREFIGWEPKISLDSALKPFIESVIKSGQ